MTHAALTAATHPGSKRSEKMTPAQLSTVRTIFDVADYAELVLGHKACTIKQHVLLTFPNSTS